jgi:hypothetical protein
MFLRAGDVCIPLAFKAVPEQAAADTAVMIETRDSEACGENHRASRMPAPDRMLHRERNLAAEERQAHAMDQLVDILVRGTGEGSKRVCRRLPQATAHFSVFFPYGPSRFSVSL